MMTLAEMERERIVASSARESRQRHGGKLVQHEANVARQRAVMNLVCAVIQGLECLRVKQAYKEIVG